MSLDRIHGTDNKDLMSKLKRAGVIKSERVLEIMSAVDRRKYAAEGKSYAYVDAPMSIGYNATISAPHMHAFALEYLSDKLTPGSCVLDVGSGSGYLTVCMALMVSPTGKAIGIEHIPELRALAKKNIENDRPDLLASGRIKLIGGDGRNGYVSEAPYSAIHVGAAADDTPQTLLDQLAPGGRLITPIGPSEGCQMLVQFDKTEDGRIMRQHLMGVRYVPLTDRRSQYQS